MLSHLVLISSLVLGASLLLLGNALNNTLLVVRGSLEGFSEQMLGFIGSAYFVGYLLGAYIAPHLIRSIGHIRAFAFFAAAIAAFILMYALFVDQWIWLGLRFVTGIALIGFYMIIESWLNSQSPAERRGQIFAVYMVANMLSMAAAQQFLRLAPPQTFMLFSVAAIMVCLSVMPVATTRLPQPAINSAPRRSR